MPLIFKRSLIKCQNPFLRIFCTTGYERLDKLLFTDETKESDCESTPDDSKQKRARSIKVFKHFRDQPHLNELKSYIPSKYFFLKQRLSIRHLYLLDRHIAKSIASHVLPLLQKNKEHVICETNAGLGLITAELFDNGIKSVRLYESCSEFRERLRDFDHLYPEKVELFENDLFNLGLISNIDKHDGGNRVEQLLRGIPKRSWLDDPSLTVIGPMPNLSFINYLMRMLTLQQEIITLGRTQIFALMKPKDYIKLTATPAMDLHVYQAASILFQLFFDCELLEKYPRTSFLPWETKLKLGPHTHAHSKIDLDYIYLVKINFKAVLPTEPQYLLHLYYFIKQGFLKGRPTVIPTVEKWMPGIGVTLIAPKQERRNSCFRHMTIYTEFGQLNPTQILHIFLKMLEQPQYQSSPFVAIVESQLLKSETIESDLTDRSLTRSKVKNLPDNIT